MGMQSRIKNFISYSAEDKMATFTFKLNTLVSKFRGRISLKTARIFFGIEIGKNPQAWGKIVFIRGAKSSIVIGNNVSLISDPKRSGAAPTYANTRFKTFDRGSKIIIGDNVGLNGTSITARSKRIMIGNGTIIAPNVTIVDSDFHIAWPPENRDYNPGYENDADVTIGSNVWIGMNSIILKGVSLGNNSIVAAGSVVTKSFPENVLIGGAPAKMLKKYDDSAAECCLAEKE